MKIEVDLRDPATFLINVTEFTDFTERVRHACSVALGDLLARGMPSPATSTGKLLTEVLHEIEALRVQKATP